MNKATQVALLTLLLILPALFLWKLTIAGRIVVGLDPLNFFYPYHDAVASALAAGQFPQWNPYLFGGAPFIADPQAQFFYPLAWLFWGMDAPTALTWSITLHLAIAGIGTYLWARRGLGMGAVGAFVSGVIFALGGYLGAQVEHINQVAAAAWLPYILLGYDMGRGTTWVDGRAVTVIDNTVASRRARTGGVILSAVALGMSFLAGHAQTTFISLAILGLWALRWAVRDDARTKAEVLAAQRSGSYAPVVQAAWRNFIGVNFVPLALIVVAGALLAAVQLVPTQQLSALSTRAHGLTFREAIAFSFDPRIALRAFFPTFGQDDRLFSEYVAWVGFSGLALAALGTWRGRRAARDFGWLSCGTGLFLALGGYNPIFYLLWRFIPGFDLFRVPARWLLLYALGAAILAGAGIEGRGARSEERGTEGNDRNDKERQEMAKGRGRLSLAPTFRSGKGNGTTDEGLETTTSASWFDVRRIGKWGWLLIAVLVVGIVAVAIIGDFPALSVLPWWVGAAVIAISGMVVLLWSNNGTHNARRKMAAQGLMVGIVLVELWLGSWGLDYQKATAAEAYNGMRTTVAHLLTVQSAPSAGRVLSKSDLTWDPGDLSRLQERYAGQLSDEAIYDLVVATKQKEILAPNQPMRWGITSADGYGGGLLPSARWVSFLNALPLAKIVPDGRLREQLTEIPNPSLLDVMGVEWLVADKVQDWWSEGIYHDLGAPRNLQEGDQIIWLPPVGQRFMTTDALSFVVIGPLPDAAGTVTLAGQPYSLNDAEERATRTTPRGEEHHYYLPLNQTIVGTPVLTLDASGTWTLGGLTLWDSQLRGFEALAADPTLTTTLSGDVKVYRREEYGGRAWLVPTVRYVPDADVAAGALSDATFDAHQVAMVERDTQVAEQFGGTGEIVWVDSVPGRLVLGVDAPEGGWLVVADAPFPGWSVTIDDQPAEWYPANVINRTVEIPAGTHTVVWTYDTPGLLMGSIATAIGILVIIGYAIWGARR